MKGTHDSKIITSNPYGKANGFSFKEYNANLMLDTIISAKDLFKNKSQWINLMKTGMTQDWSWERSAREYIELYKMPIKESKN